jgi:hypothetical protein
MSHSFMLCTRATRGGQFIPEPGTSRYLKIPKGQTPRPDHAIPRNQWVRELLAAATWGTDARRNNAPRGDILVYIHGYNNDLATITSRHKRLETDLAAQGFKGVILTFCWPSDNKPIAYLEDRHDAKTCAMQLVTDGIALLSRHQSADCSINIHLLAHSTGAYVVREAFDDADDSILPNGGWSVSQVAFIAADVSSGSMSAENATSESIYRHCARLTNYQNKHDSVLKLSNVKRVGVAPRVGRAGLPDDAPSKAVNVDCSDYFELLEGNPQTAAADQSERIGTFDHSWQIGNRTFARDLFHTLIGDLDRDVIPTRAHDGSGAIRLVRSPA